MKVILTGAAGFLGWHTRLRLHALTEHTVIPVTRENWADLPKVVAEADAIIHVAGVNRGTDEAVARSNISLAEEVAAAVRMAGRPLRVVYAGTIKADQPGAYGEGKRAAGEALAGSSRNAGGSYVDVVLPNLFGEHCRPHYNSFSATFIDHVVKGTEPLINDGCVGLLHVQDAAAHLIDALTTQAGRIDPKATDVGIQAVWDLLQEFHANYIPTGEIPDLSSKFRIDLFNAYRTALFPGHYPIKLTPHTDTRGTFVETVRSRGGEGQTSFSTTAPGVTRGEHYHLSKIERFAVIRGRATMELRRLFTDDVLSFEVDGDVPVAIDMPVGWAHNLTNTGSEVLLTQFWSHELFRPEAPDTFPEHVRL